MKPKLFRGTIISPGLSRGIIHLHHTLLTPLDIPVAISSSAVDDECSRLDLATTTISNELLVLAARIEKEIDSRLAEVFESHQMIVNDQLLKAELRKEISENLITAGSAVKRVFLRWEKRFLLMESQISRDKSDDLRDISLRLRHALAGITINSLEKIPKYSVLATSRLLPSDTVFLASSAIKAILLEYGSVGSHASLFTREMGIPCMFGFANIDKVLPDKAGVQIDADRGYIVINPHLRQQRSFLNKLADKRRHDNAIYAQAQQPAITQDGFKISVMANVSTGEDVNKAVLNGAEGIGLYRMEQHYVGFAKPPNVSELFQDMSNNFSAIAGKPICVRLLDIGADKPLPYLDFLAESNPALGRRGVRLLREYPELLKTQLRAILELSRDFDISVLIPMVTREEDIIFVKRHLHELCVELALSGKIKLGAMIETPAAALDAETLAQHVDFFSFGTNDLSQYIFAADRESAIVEQYGRNNAKVIFKILKMVHREVPKVPLSICGEFAGNTKYVERLLRCGIRTLSVAVPLIPQVKEAIRKASINYLPTLAQNEA